MGIKWRFWRKDEDESEYERIPIVFELPKKPEIIPKVVHDSAEEDLADLKAYVGTDIQGLDISNTSPANSILKTPYPNSIDLINRNYSYQNYTDKFMRDSEGKKIYCDWPPSWLAYQRKYKCFVMLREYNKEYGLRMSADALAMNVGLSLNSVKSGLSKWTRSKHVSAERNKDGKLAYWLEHPGSRLLKNLKEFQPVWCKARDRELARWNVKAAARWQQFDRIDLHSTHTILKENGLE